MKTATDYKTFQNVSIQLIQPISASYASDLHGHLSQLDADILVCSGQSSISLEGQLENVLFLTHLVQCLEDKSQMERGSGLPKFCNLNKPPPKRTKQMSSV